MFVYVNFFILLILNGFCFDSGGKVNEKVLCKNLILVIDVYIFSVDKVFCVGIEIYLYYGLDSFFY